MNAPVKNSDPAIELGFIVRCVTIALMLAATGVAFVYVKNQQHALGMETSKIEAELKDLRAYNQVLEAEVTTLSSHARINELVAKGDVALVPISGQYVARLAPPAHAIATGEIRTAAAQTAGEFRQ